MVGLVSFGCSNQIPIFRPDSRFGNFLLPNFTMLEPAARARDCETLACHALLDATMDATPSRTKCPEPPLVSYGTAVVLPTDFTSCQRPSSVGAVSWKLDLLGAKCPRNLTAFTRSTRLGTKTQQQRSYTWHSKPAPALGRVFRASVVSKFYTQVHTRQPPPPSSLHVATPATPRLSSQSTVYTRTPTRPWLSSGLPFCAATRQRKLSLSNESQQKRRPTRTPHPSTSRAPHR